MADGSVVMPNYRVGDRLRLLDPHLEVPDYLVTRVEGTSVAIKGGHFGELEAVVPERDLDGYCERVGYRIGDQLRVRGGDPDEAPVVVVTVFEDSWVQLAGVIGGQAGVYHFDVASVDEVYERVVHAPSPHWPAPKLGKTSILPEQVPIKAPTARSAWDWLNSSEDEE